MPVRREAGLSHGVRHCVLGFSQCTLGAGVPWRRRPRTGGTAAAPAHRYCMAPCREFSFLEDRAWRRVSPRTLRAREIASFQRASAAVAVGRGASQPRASRRDNGVRSGGGGGCVGGHMRSQALRVSQTLLYGDAHRRRPNSAARSALSPQPELPRRDAGCRRSAWSRRERQHSPLDGWRLGLAVRRGWRLCETAVP
jgi:hypothetical protein